MKGMLSIGSLFFSCRYIFSYVKMWSSTFIRLKKCDALRFSVGKNVETGV